MDQQTVQAVTFATALVGAVLGVINAWRAWSSDRVKLRVRVSHAIGIGGEAGLLIDVVNLSSFPVTVARVGFGLVASQRHLQIPQPVCMGGEQFPVRLEARAAVTVLQPLAAFDDEQILTLDHAYIHTACGLTRKSQRRFFRKLHDAAGARAP